VNDQNASFLLSCKNSFFDRSASWLILKNVIKSTAFPLIVILANISKMNYSVKKIFWLFAVAIVFASCNRAENFSIQGTLSNAQNATIYLEKLEISGSIPFDSAKIDGKGNFKLRGKVSYPTFFLLKLKDEKFVTLLIDSLEKISFSADIINFARDYKITGSDGSQKVKELNSHLQRTNTKIDSISYMLNQSIGNPNYDVQKNAWIAEINAIIENQISYSKLFVINNPFSLAAVLAIYQKFNNGEYVIQDLQTIKVAASALHSMYPNSIHAQTLYNDTEKLIRSIRSDEMNSFIDQNAVNSPDINLPDVNKKQVALSSLQGKVVLVQFWSAQDRVSRIQNEVLKENYQKYKSKGFEIYQVSVDKDEQMWKKAIEEDDMNWINVGDMNGSVEALNLYNISKIPSNYLLGKDGAILAKDLKGPSLFNKLSEILN
jgi:peroxiredoxin